MSHFISSSLKSRGLHSQNPSNSKSLSLYGGLIVIFIGKLLFLGNLSMILFLFFSLGNDGIWYVIQDHRFQVKYLLGKLYMRWVLLLICGLCIHIIKAGAKNML